MDRKQLVISILKPKAKDLGFNKSELKSIAAQIADNLKAEEDASEEDVTKEATATIDALLPILKLSQSQANRLLDEYKSQHQSKDDDDDDDDDDDSKPSKKNRQKGNNQNEPSKEMKEMLEALTTLTAEVKSLKDGKTSDKRKEQFIALLGDVKETAFGKRLLKDFSRLTFKDDEDFEEYLSDAKSDLDEYKKQTADISLTPPAGNRQAPSEAASDAEIESLAKMLG